MARVKEAVLKTCMLVQQLKEEYFVWGAERSELFDQARNGDLSGIMNHIGNLLYQNRIVVQEMHGIIHDNDWRSDVWDELSHQYIVQKKPDHFHIVMKFKNGFSSSLPNIASAIGVEPQSIEKAKKGKYSYDNMLAYLIHIKDADKTQYDASRVVSNGLSRETTEDEYNAYMANGGALGYTREVEYDDDMGGTFKKTEYYIPDYLTYQEIYADKRAEWIKGRAKVTAQRAKVDIDIIEEAILTGQITKSQLLLTDEYYAIYSRNARRCEDALRAYGERRAYKTLQALENGDYKLSVFFITGMAGAGKTRLAREFVDRLIKRSAEHSEAWRVCQTAASNPMDDYNGEEILFMDDIRGTALSSSDWLKLLDPYNNSPASARYKNKVPACRVIVITSTKDPIEFFYFCKQMGGGDRSEALDQFMRRIQCLVQVIRADDFADTRARIAECEKSGEYQAIVPNSNRLGSPATVNLSYTFEGESVTEVSFDKAVEILTETAMRNNNLNSEVKGQA